MKSHSIGLLAASAALVLPAAAGAQNAYNSFGPGDSFTTNTGWTVSGSSSVVGQPYSDAMLFTSAASGGLSNITVAVSYVTGTDSAIVSLCTDSGGNPGSVLESWTTGSLPTFGTSFSPTVLSNAVAGLSLTAGTNYFVVVAPGAGDTWDAWNWNSQGISGGGLQSGDGGATWGPSGDPVGAYSVQVTPEPAPIAILGLGILPVIGLRRKNRH